MGRLYENQTIRTNTEFPIAGFYNLLLRQLDFSGTIIDQNEIVASGLVFDKFQIQDFKFQDINYNLKF